MRAAVIIKESQLSAIRSQVSGDNKMACHGGSPDMRNT